MALESCNGSMLLYINCIPGVLAASCLFLMLCIPSAPSHVTHLKELLLPGSIQDPRFRDSLLHRLYTSHPTPQVLLNIP